MLAKTKSVIALEDLNVLSMEEAGTAMLETAERMITEDREPALQQFLLLVGGLRALTGSDGSGVEKPHSQVLDSYLLRSLAVAGYAPSFEACARCGEMGPHRWFHPAAGGVLCPTCKLPGSAGPAPDARRRRPHRRCVAEVG